MFTNFILDSIKYLIFLLGLFFIFITILYPFIYLYCWYKLKVIRKKRNDSDAKNDRNLEYNINLRYKYLLYKSTIDGLNPFNFKPSFYFVKPLLKKQFKDSHYALFLRGFENDSYLYDIRLRASRQFVTFSEFHFLNYLDKYIKTYTVGMTKEILPAVGATRIYLDDNSWKSDVIDLMQNAYFIIVLINDSPNCIWEIEQSLKFMSKTIYIIDDIIKYRNVLETLQEKGIHGLPNLPFSYNCYFFYTTDKLVINPISNCTDNYEKNVEYIARNFLEFNKKRKYIFFKGWNKI